MNSWRHPQRLGAIGGPISLLFLPKCPLCFAYLLAAGGVIIPGAMGQWLVAGLLIGAWFAMLFVKTRGRPVLRTVATIGAAASAAAIAMQIWLLLWPAVALMTAAGVLAVRACHATRMRAALPLGNG